MKAIILCAGLGERLRPLTENIPKPMIPIDDKPSLEYLILLCKKHGINEIAINTSYLPEKIKEYFGNGEKFGVKIKYSFESELLGTSGALNNFKDFFDDTFFVIYGDNLTDLDLTRMLEYHKAKKSMVTMYIYRETMIDYKTSIGCIVVDEQNQIQEIVENPSKEDQVRLKEIPAKRKFINAGLYILEPSVLSLVPEGYSDFAKNILPAALQKGNLFGFTAECYFKEIGQMPRYLKAKQDIESGQVKLDL